MLILTHQWISHLWGWTWKEGMIFFLCNQSMDQPVTLSLVDITSYSVKFTKFQLGYQMPRWSKISKRKKNNNNNKEATTTTGLLVL